VVAEIDLQFWMLWILLVTHWIAPRVQQKARFADSWAALGSHIQHLHRAVRLILHHSRTMSRAQTRSNARLLFGHLHVTFWKTIGATLIAETLIAELFISAPQISFGIFMATGTEN
jgi:hypothetical protein